MIRSPFDKADRSGADKADECAATIRDYDALLFDMDGLLVDSEPLWFRVTKEFAEARGAEFSDELARACVGKGIVATLSLLRDQYGARTDPNRDADVLVDSFIARVGELSLKSGAREILSAARGRVSIALGSSSARRLVVATLSATGIAADFSVVVCGDDVPSAKPSPDIFLKAAADLGVVPERCVVLEDSMAGVTSALSAGMRVVAIPEVPRSDVEGAATIVSRDLNEARVILGL